MLPTSFAEFAVWGERERARESEVFISSKRKFGQQQRGAAQKTYHLLPFSFTLFVVDE
jgi:hypothetical protein